MGATVLDFAFNIHSGVGCRCSGARINGKAASIREKLNTGDVVEIITTKTQRPSADWLNWVVSAKARSKIRQELDAEERKLASEGREMLERRLKNWKMEFSDEMVLEFCKKNKYAGQIPMYAAVGRGDLDVNEIKDFILAAPERAEESVAAAIAFENSRPTGYTSTGDDILVLNARDVKGLQYKMARCCNPVFGDDVFGFVTRGEGIKIHRISCPNAARLIEKYPYRIQKVKWQETQSSGEFLVSLVVSAVPDSTVMSQIMDGISRFRVSLRSLTVNKNARTGEDDMQIKLLVPSNSELDKVISILNRIKNVTRVKRV